MSAKRLGWADAPDVLKPADVAAVLGVSKSTAYELMRRPGFPAVHLSERVTRVAKVALRAWLTDDERRIAR